ncbi:DNA-formamidopyrimidine glycosylase family protein [Kribbella sp.]|uniref:DNA-formamidopyrimidine glycosylase family protein n=1 Tax=Kribbella sp. TaxID=1871183 RepID=UPI002D55F12D|nr:DNA-formamidopyrimidine glycosylase family protein [Kribbella sp.]HZX08764.1 DNA-formamidopyrimidine glycosylase family protein [Kribbella sp.]
MPELPDVEGFRRVLADHAAGRPIRRVEVLDAGVLRGVTATGLRHALVGHRFRRPWRHGKYLVVPLTGSRREPAVLLHFGMTGSLDWTDDGQRLRDDRVVFGFAGGELRYRDLRKLQGLRLAPDREAVDQLLDGLGPDATELSADALGERLAGRRGQLKPTLMDQSTVAGLGNLLTDEILWRARIDPAPPVLRTRIRGCPSAAWAHADRAASVDSRRPGSASQELAHRSPRRSVRVLPSLRDHSLACACRWPRYDVVHTLSALLRWKALARIGR